MILGKLTVLMKNISDSVSMIIRKIKVKEAQICRK